MNLQERVKALSKAFINRNVKLAIGIPGTGPGLDFISAFVKEGGKFILCKNEASAAIMAGTLAKNKKQPVISLCANGTARMNLLSGVSHCWFEKLPIIALWDCYGNDIPEYQTLQRLPKHDVSPFFNELLNGLNQQIDETAEFLIKSSLNPEPGPVGLFLRLSENDLPFTENEKEDSTYIERPSSLQLESKKPVIIFGSDVAFRFDTSTIRELFSFLQIPKLMSIGAKGLFEETDNFNLRVFTGVGGKNTFEHIVIEESDLVIGVNLRHSDVIKVKAFDRPTILFDTERLDQSTGFDSKQYFVHSIADIAHLLSHTINPEWTEERCIDIINHSEKMILTQENEAAIFIQHMSTLLYGKTTVVVDDGIYQKQSEYFWKTSHPSKYVATGTGRNMGSALPAAIALSITNKEESVVCLTGDGGLPFFLGELSLLSQFDTHNLLIVHFADFSLGSIKTRKLKNIDTILETQFSYCEVMKGFGFHTFSTDDIDRGLETIRQWKNEKCNLFLEFKLNRDIYPETFFKIR